MKHMNTPLTTDEAWRLFEQGLQIERLTRYINEAYARWESGEGASPSATDLVVIASEVDGMRNPYDMVSLDGTDAVDQLSDLVFRMQSWGATTGTVARFLVEALS